MGIVVCQLRKAKIHIFTYKERSEPYHRVIRFGSLLSPPDSWGRQLAAGAVNKDKSEPHHRVMRLGFVLSPPDSWGRQPAAGVVSDDKPEPKISSILSKAIRQFGVGEEVLTIQQISQKRFCLNRY